MKRLLVSVLAAGTFAGCGGQRAASGCDAFRVDHGAWSSASASQRSPAGPPSVRQKIADRIVECRTLGGSRKGQVIGALGRPTARDSGGWWYYDLGTERRLGGLDNEQLSVHFDAKGRVDRVEIGTS